jgi:hypothetical protein
MKENLMKRKFKVIATATVAVGMVGLATQAMSQESREQVRGEVENAVLQEIQAACAEALAGEGTLSGRPAPDFVINEFSKNCAGNNQQ